MPITSKVRLLTPHEVINIFEDFRQERILNGFFINVDFKENVYRVNQMTQEEVLDAYDKEPFYSICRFDFGSKEDLEKRNALFEKWKGLDASLDLNLYDYQNEITVKQYLKDIWAFYLDVLKRFLEKKEEEEKQKNSPDRNGNKGKGDTNDGEDKQNKNQQEQQQENAGEDDDDSVDMTQNQPNFEQSDDEIQDSNEFSKQHGALGQSIREIADKVIFGSDNSYVSAIQNIISERKKQLIAEGNKVAIGYSGKINPRAFAQPNNNDWKVFKREGGRCRGGDTKKLWINFFIDGSGSYTRNIKETQKVINSFKIASRGFTIFDYQVYVLDTNIIFSGKKYDPGHCNYNSHLNCLEIRNAINKIGRSKYDIVNIILVDGKVSQNTRALLDKTDIIFIADLSCKEYFDVWFKNATKFYVQGQYPQELFKEVSKILRRKVR